MSVTLTVQAAENINGRGGIKGSAHDYCSKCGGDFIAGLTEKASRVEFRLKMAPKTKLNYEKRGRGRGKSKRGAPD